MSEEKKRWLSISQLNMMSRCGEQYRRRYICGEKIPPAVAMIVGRAVDDSVGENLGRKLAGKKLMPLIEVRDQAATTFNRIWGSSDVQLNEDETEQGIKVTRGLALDKTVRLAGLHSVRMAPIIEPTHLQRKIEVELPGYPYDLVGWIDIQEGMKSLRDTKTSGKTPPADAADKDDQLTTYAMMVEVIDHAIPRKLCLDYLIDVKTPKAQTYSTTRTKEDFEPLLRRVEATSLAVEKGVFIPARETDWFCSERWCGFWRTCPFTKKSKRPTS